MRSYTETYEAELPELFKLLQRLFPHLSFKFLPPAPNGEPKDQKPSGGASVRYTVRMRETGKQDHKDCSGRRLLTPSLALLEVLKATLEAIVDHVAAAMEAAKQPCDDATQDQASKRKRVEAPAGGGAGAAAGTSAGASGQLGVLATGPELVRGIQQLMKQLQADNEKLQEDNKQLLEDIKRLQERVDGLEAAKAQLATRVEAHEQAVRRATEELQKPGMLANARLQEQQAAVHAAHGDEVGV